MTAVDYHPDLQCALDRMEVTQEVVTFFLPADHCTDMTGAIKVATAVHPDVRVIRTVAGGHADTCYRKAHGSWHAMNPEEQTA